MNPTPKAANHVLGPIAIGDTSKSRFSRSRRINETPTTWLERLCDEHNAPVREQF
jgi:hypothetical protein